MGPQGIPSAFTAQPAAGPGIGSRPATQSAATLRRRARLSWWRRCGASILAGLALAAGGGCEGQQQQRGPGKPSGATGRSASPEGGAQPARPAGARARPGIEGRAPRPRDDSPNRWSIVLATFAGDGHAAAAKDAHEKLGQRIPEFRTSVVRTTGRGSMILWGSYPGPDDPAAQAEIKRVQQFEWRGARPFASAMLVRPEQTQKAPSGPHDLRNLRLRHPDQDPLYTLQVAAWADFDGTMSLEQIRRSAEGHAARLRAQGFEAWFHHDDDLRMSVVTIGAFGQDAWDPRSTLYSREVELLMRKFPQHLVNGEPLMLRIDPHNPRSREYAQPCMLVFVPAR